MAATPAVMDMVAQDYAAVTTRRATHLGTRKEASMN